MTFTEELKRMQHFGQSEELARKVQEEMQRIEPVCMEDGCEEILTEEEEEEGRCRKHSDDNAIDIYLTGLHPDAV